ncbi:MAG: DNA topoisomerase III [Ruminococcaceae bacterium]|nr:DNA topoisomerase III [Oscillospiraceae bacterium]
MAKTLVLAEKPSVGREIARVLGCKNSREGYIEGEKYVVTWALGHLVTLADPEMYDEKYKKWEMTDLPMLPERMNLVVIRETSRQFKVVSSLMKRGDISELVIATDSGREGELVARWIMIKAGFHKPAKRLWISSQTDKAIKEGFASLKPASQYDDLYKSAKARSEADWLVGLNVTRALTCKFNAQLSAGRVQTPTLAMIVRREEEIKRFVPKDYWTVSVQCDGFTAIWRDKNNQTRIFDKTAAEKLCEAVKGKTATLTGVKKDAKLTFAPALYDLTELQRDANKKYAYTAKETLSYMQSLYETHKVLTYPRTDSRYITSDVAATLPDRIKAVFMPTYAPIVKAVRTKPLDTRRIVDNSKVTDHHAIIPTEQPADLSKMSGPERNIYDLVVRRFLATLLPAFEYEETRLVLSVNGESFHAHGKIVKNAGWKAAYDKVVEDEGDEDEKEQSLPAVKSGDKLAVRGAKLHSAQTKPPARYTEATLLSAMENPSGQVSDAELAKILRETAGLGTPATRADIIEKLFSSFYVERRGKEIVATSKGVQLISLVPEQLRSALLTAQWEKQLELISRGKMKDEAFVADMRKYATKLVAEVKSSNAVYTHDNATREKCPECGKYLLDVKGKRGRMLVCQDRECGYRRSVSQTTNARCPNCHKRMELRGEGEKRMFACICGYREKLSDFEKRTKESGAGKRDVQSYMAKQRSEQIAGGNTALAEQLAKWKAQNDK